MDLDARLQEVTVVGAAGKMGSGISLLLAEEMAFQKLLHPDRVYVLYLVDINEKGLEGLWHYIRNQMVSTAEKQIIRLRDIYKDRQGLSSNEEIIQDFVYTVLCMLRPSTCLEVARKSSLVFEAAIEDVSLKTELFQKLKAICSPNVHFFTNTSSIPLHIIEEKADIEGRVIGLHFYNPPAIQKLLEIIPSENSTEELVACASELAKRLRKTIVYAKDIAGFIGNGHFIREGIYACERVCHLEKEYGAAQAVYLINRVTQDFLLRPMGIFQLIDYVGIDVFHCIQKVMSQYLHGENLLHKLIDEMVSAKVLGGQYSDGSPKDGFFKYEKGRPVGVYELKSANYIPMKDCADKLDTALGALPRPQLTWKTLLNDEAKDAKMREFFASLKRMTTSGSTLAQEYARQSEIIAQQLVADHVAQSPQDVNAVLMTGFYHLYGPIGNYLASQR